MDIEQSSYYSLFAAHLLKSFPAAHGRKMGAHSCYCTWSIVPSKWSLSCQIGLAVCELLPAANCYSMRLRFLQFDEGLWLPVGPWNRGAKAIKSSSYKLKTVILRIAVYLGELCLYSYSIPKIFSEDVLLYILEAGVCFQLILWVWKAFYLPFFPPVNQL